MTNILIYMTTKKERELNQEYGFIILTELESHKFTSIHFQSLK